MMQDVQLKRLARIRAGHTIFWFKHSKEAALVKHMNSLGKSMCCSCNIMELVLSQQAASPVQPTSEPSQ